MNVELTGGVITAAMQGQVPPKSYLQILSSKIIRASNQDEERVRLHISDGDYSYTFVTLAGTHNHLFHEKRLERFTVICVDKILCYCINNKTVMVILELDVVLEGKHVNKVLGTPVVWTDEQQSSTDSTTLKCGTVAAPSMSRATPENVPAVPSHSPNEAQFALFCPIAPIQDVNPYLKNLTIRARVVRKGDIKPFSKKPGKLFSVELLDMSGRIQMTGFNSAVDTFYDKLEVNKVYYISNFRTTRANKKFTSASIPHEYELQFQQGTQVLPCQDDTSDIPEVIPNFISIRDISGIEAGQLVDVIGVCKSCGECQVKILRDLTETEMRELTVVDDSGAEITLTLWGNRAKEFADETQPVIAVEKAKVTDFNGKSLSCLSTTVFHKNPHLDAAEHLRSWFDNGGYALQPLNLSSGYNARLPWKLAAEVQDSLLSDQVGTFRSQVTLVKIQWRNAVYRACINCRKKVEYLRDGKYRCARCEKETIAEPRLILLCCFADFTDCFWATSFHETSESMLKKKGEELVSLFDSNPDEFEKLVHRVLLRQFVGTFQVSKATASTEGRKKFTILELSELNHGEYAKELLNDIRESAN